MQPKDRKFSEKLTLWLDLAAVRDTVSYIV